MTLLTISSVKEHAIADNGSRVTLTVEAKHVGELDVLLPATCFDDLISALTQAKSLLGGPAATPRRAAPDPKPEPPRKPGQLTVKLPKKWLVTSETKAHGLVLLIFDHETDDQAGFALPADDCKKIADGLLKNADSVLAAKAQKAP